MLTVSLILAGALAAQAPAKTPAADDFVGRWNVRITDAADTFVERRLPDHAEGRAPSSPASSGAGAATFRRSPWS